MKSALNFLGSPLTQPNWLLILSPCPNLYRSIHFCKNPAANFLNPRIDKAKGCILFWQNGNPFKRVVMVAMQRFWLSMLAVIFLLTPTSARSNPPGFVSIADLHSSIIVEARYQGSHNFVGGKIDGYFADKCILTLKAAKALAKVQSEVKKLHLSLKVYDCYRPQRAVDHFVRWAKNLKDVKMKAEFYPGVEKKNLFRDGYIDSRSGHSRGSTVDLTLVQLPAARQEKFAEGSPLQDCRNPSTSRFSDNSLDMGTGYDCFDPLSHTDNPTVSQKARENRLLLKSVMEKHGFVNYSKEWWHFTLRKEPFKNKYFDFSVE